MGIFLALVMAIQNQYFGPRLKKGRLVIKVYQLNVWIFLVFPLKNLPVLLLRFVYSK